MNRFLLALLFLLPLASCETSGPSLPPLPHKPSQLPHKDTVYLGMGLYEAEALARSRGLEPRVVRVDGQLQPATKDLRPNRVNFDIKNGVVSHAVRG